MRILLTGATGLLGSHIIEEAQRKNHEIFCLYRNLNKRSLLATLEESVNIKTIEFDLTESNFDELPKDMDVVINCAAFASPFEKDREIMNKVNFEAVKSLYLWSKKIGVKQFVQISSIACFGAKSFEETIDESSTQEFRPTHYAQTKKNADNWLDQQNGIGILTIHPCYILGKWDSHPSSGSIFFALKMKRLQHFINHTKSFVAASDVAKGIFKALEKRVTGHYILGGDNFKIKEFIKTACKKLNLECCAIKEVPQDFDHREHEISEQESSLIQEFCHAYPVNYNKAIHDFDYSPEKKLDEMIDETLKYFAEKRMLRVKK